MMSSTRLFVGTDLRAAIREAIEECEADGWTVENDGVYGFFFCNRDGEWREVRIQPPIGLNRLGWPVKIIF